MDSLICSQHGASTADHTLVVRPIKDAKTFSLSSSTTFLVDLRIAKLTSKQRSLMGNQNPIKYKIVKGHNNVMCGEDGLVNGSTIACDSDHKLELEFDIDDETLAAYAEVILNHYDETKHAEDLRDEKTKVNTGENGTVTVPKNSLFYLFCKVVRSEKDNSVEIRELENSHVIDKRLATLPETRQKYKKFLCMCRLLMGSVEMDIRSRADVHLTMVPHDIEEEEEDVLHKKTEILFSSENEDEDEDSESDGE